MRDETRPELALVVNEYLEFRGEFLGFDTIRVYVSGGLIGPGPPPLVCEGQLTVESQLT